MDKNKLNYAVIGLQGGGKSSLVYGLLGLDPQNIVSSEAVPATSHPHPNLNDVILWDLPGAGTLEHPQETYYEDMALEDYDAILIVKGESRMVKFEVEIAKRCQEARKRVLFVQSRADLFIRDIKMQNKFSMAEAAEMFRNQIVGSFLLKFIRIDILIVSHRALLKDKAAYKFENDTSLEGMDEKLLTETLSEMTSEFERARPRKGKESIQHKEKERKVFNIRFEKLQLGKRLGRGAYGVVRKASYNGREVAAKHIFEDTLENEAIEVHRHPHVLTLYGCAKNERDAKKCWIVMELMETDLCKLMLSRKFSFAEAIDAMLQIGKGMKHLHDSNILHRDLKPQNVLVNIDGTKLILKLADFGTVKSNFDTNDPNQHTFRIGTHNYMAPEMRVNLVEGKYNRTVDVYSYGITCWEILTCVPDYAHLKRGQESDSPLWLKWGQESDSPLAQLLNSCCSQEPRLRPSFGKICDDLLSLQSSL